MHSPLTYDLPTRADLARELLLFRLRLLCSQLLKREWDEALVQEVWRGIQQTKPPFMLRTSEISPNFVLSFRNLAELAQGWFTAGADDAHQEFVLTDEWVARCGVAPVPRLAGIIGKS